MQNGGDARVTVQSLRLLSVMYVGSTGLAGELETAWMGGG
jgi:hypothetical protein